MANSLQKLCLLFGIAVCFVQGQIHIENYHSGNVNPEGVELQNSVLQTCATEVNNARRNEGKNEISYHTQVEAAAKLHNDYMIANNCFSGQCPGESSLGSRLSSTGYRWENVGQVYARGQSSCQAVVNVWLNPGPRDVMLGNYQHFGCSTGGDDRYWTCVFASPLLNATQLYSF